MLHDLLLRRVEPGEFPQRPPQLAPPDLVGAAGEARHKRLEGEILELFANRRDLFLDDRLRLMSFLLPLLLMLVDDLFQVVNIVNGNTLNIRHVGIDVPRHGDVNKNQRASAALAHRPLRFPRMNNVMRRSRGCHHDIDVRRRFQPRIKIHRLAAELRRHFLRFFPMMVGDVNLFHAAPQKILRRQLGHLPCAEDQRARRLQCPENIPRQLDRRIAHGYRVERDPRLGAHPFPRRNRPVKQGI